MSNYGLYLVFKKETVKLVDQDVYKSMVIIQGKKCCATVTFWAASMEIAIMDETDREIIRSVTL